MRAILAGTFVGLLVCHSVAQAQDKIAVTLTVAKDITGPTPVCVPLTVTPEQSEWRQVVGKNSDGQLTVPGLLTEHIKAKGNGVRRDLHFIISDQLAAGTKVTFTFPFPRELPMAAQQPNVFWENSAGDHVDLIFGKRRVLRYMYKAYDDSSADKRNKTYKVFHHLFDPSGKRLVTNGGYTDESITDVKKLLYPHHRGLQMGFNKITYAEGKKKADTWHCQKDDYQSHEGFLATEVNDLMGRHRVAIDWHGANKEVIVKEEREMTVYNLPGGTMVEFASRLKPAHGNVKLDGDPQHAGFQFRAANEVAEKTAKQTYYLRPDGKGEPGATRNWSAEETDQVNLPWDAMSFVVGGQRYTVCYLDHPNNPHPARFSERDYGRFGCYFEHVLTPEMPLVLNYRVWLQQGEMTGDQVQALSNQFVAPPRATKK